MDNLEESSLISGSNSPTCFVVDPDGLEVVDGSQSSTLLFQAGQTVQLEDGSTAFLSAASEVDGANLHQVELENGTTAFIALDQSSMDTLGLEQGLQMTSVCNFLKVEHTEELEQQDMDENAESEVLEYPLGLTEDGESRTQFSMLGLDPDESNDQLETDHSIKKIEILESYEPAQLDEPDEQDHLEEIDNEDEDDGDDDDTDEGNLCKSQQRKAQSEKTKNFACSVPGCPKKYTALHHLKVHARTHTGDRPFTCTQPLCDKKFGTNYALKAHIRTHTGEKPYHCPEESCGKGFKTSGDLQKHIRTHTGERPFKCNVPGCNRSFTTSNIRKVHVRTHTGERPYECTEPGCGRAFASATNFKNHMRIHSGEKPYVCTVKMCGRRFTEYSSLYKHQTVHTQQKPYECRDCGRNYRQSSTLTMHRRTAHGIIQALDGSEIVLSLPNNAGKMENFMFLELTKDGSTLIPLNGNRGGVTSSSSARHTDIDLDEDSNNGENEDDDDLMKPSEVIEDDDNSLRQIFVVSEDGDITYENFDALDSAVI